MLKKLILLFICIGKLIAAPINIVAAENFYGKLAEEIGGSQVSVKSILTNPNADPHLFATSPEINKALTGAQIIIYNGADYDSWIGQLLTNIDTKQVILINVADLVQVKSGANPHIWFKPETFPLLAEVLTKKINQLNPAATKLTQANLAKFLAENKKVQLAIKGTRDKYNGVQVTATEPVFGYLAEAMGLKMTGLDLQWKIMNDTEPSPMVIAMFQNLLNKREVKVLFYNSQVTDNITKNMQHLAQKNAIPIVGISETLPKNTTINAWLSHEIDLTNIALNKAQQ